MGGSNAYRKSAQFGLEIGPFGTKLNPQGQNFEKNSMVIMKTAENLENLSKIKNIAKFRKSNKNLKKLQKTKKLKNFVWGVKTC